MHKILATNDGAICPRFGVSRGSNFSIFCWKFVTSFICIFDKLPKYRFSYKLAGRRAMTSSFWFWNNICDTTIVFWDKGAEKIFLTPLISPPILNLQRQNFSGSKRPGSSPNLQNFTALTLTRALREAVKLSIFSIFDPKFYVIGSSKVFIALHLR